MSAAVSRAILAVAMCCLGESRREWAGAMRAEFETAVADGKPLPFAIGCVAAAWREMLTGEEGRYTLTSYALVLIVIIPTAALQVGCALFGLPYLYPGQDGLAGALLEVGVYEPLMRGIYQAAIPSLALLLLSIGLAHLRIAWAMLECDWSRVVRLGTLTLATTVTLGIFMGTLFLDGTQVFFQAGILMVELTTVSVVARWHAQLSPATAKDHPG